MFCRKTCVLRFGKNENKMDLVTLCYFIDRIIVTTVNRNVRIYKKKKILSECCFILKLHFRKHPFIIFLRKQAKYKLKRYMELKHN